MSRRSWVFVGVFLVFEIVQGLMLFHNVGRAVVEGVGFTCLFVGYFRWREQRRVTP